MMPEQTKTAASCLGGSQRRSLRIKPVNLYETGERQGLRLTLPHPLLAIHRFATMLFFRLLAGVLKLSNSLCLVLRVRIKD
jgi:hypothetical protein